MPFSSRQLLANLLLPILLALPSSQVNQAPAVRSAKTPNTFEIVGNSGASAQQMFLGAPTKVYVIDKVCPNLTLSTQC